MFITSSIRPLFIAASLVAASVVGFAADQSAHATGATCCKPGASCCGKDKDCCAKEATDCCDTAKGCCELLQSYVPISEALAADNLPQAKTAAAALLKQAEANGLTPMVEAARTIGSADSIAAARAAFKTLSKEITPLAEGAKGFVVMNCPMAEADWVQTDNKVRNPYYGQSMLRCGAPKAPAAK